MASVGGPALKAHTVVAIIMTSWRWAYLLS